MGENEFTTLDGCPITPAPWTVRAATFCDDGVVSYEVVMPGPPRMSAVDARVIGAAPALYAALNEIANDPHNAYESNEGGSYGIGVADGHRCAAQKARAALALVNIPTAETGKVLE